MVQSYSGLNDECHSTSQLPFCERSILVQHSQPTPHIRCHDIVGLLSSFPLLKLWNLAVYNGLIVIMIQYFFLNDFKFVLKYQYLSVCLEGTWVSEVEEAIFDRSMKAAEYEFEPLQVWPSTRVTSRRSFDSTVLVNCTILYCTRACRFPPNSCSASRLYWGWNYFYGDVIKH